MKKIICMLTLAVSMFCSTQAFAMSVEEIQCQSFAQQDYVVSAMKEFNEAFKTFRSDNAIESVEEMKPKLKAYYTDQYGAEYKKRNNGKEAPISKMFDSLDDDTIAMQYYYIIENSNPLGSKDKLDKGSDKSKWSTIHEKYHPKFRAYLEEFGLYDIFLIDIESGDIVYSVFKELDFTTSLKDGPYADTNFARVYDAIKGTSDKDMTNFVDMEPYTPSYEDPARFMGAPVFDGDTLVGVLIMQLPAGM